MSFNKDMSTDSVINNRFSVYFDYPVHFTVNSFDTSSSLLCHVFDRLGEGRRHRIVPYVDAGLAAARPSLLREIRDYAHAHSELLEFAADPVLVPGGAAAKNDMSLLKDIVFTLGNLHIDRQSFVLAIGGGSVLDAVGFATAMTHRGVRLVRMPSTVLAQADAGVGVKNGIDHHGQKNFLGIFAPPFAVVNDISLLDSLPKRERIAGLAEAVKVAIIRDVAFFAELERNAKELVDGERTALRNAVEQAAGIHLRQITTGGDPFEFGSARPLDFGHWAGHRLEIMSANAINHGEGVGVGMALDTAYAALAGLIPDSDATRIISLIKNLGLPIYRPELENTRPDGELEIIAGIANFREHLGGRLCITLPTAIGKTIEVHDMDNSLIVEAIARVKTLEAGGV